MKKVQLRVISCNIITFTFVALSKYNKRFMSKYIITLLFACISYISYGQKSLPDLDITTNQGVSILSWTNPYINGIKTIYVERSKDSIVNYSNIGVVKGLNNNIQGFVDATPFAGDNWYRVVVVFNSDIEWKSNIVKVFVDSQAIINRAAIKSKDSLEKTIVKNLEEKGKIDTAIVENVVKKVTYPKSKYVFTDPFSGNINIKLPNFEDFLYSIKFYTLEDKYLFVIPRIVEGEIILDKRNFQNLTTYKFIIYKDDKEFEKGFVTIF